MQIMRFFERTFFSRIMNTVTSEMENQLADQLPEAIPKVTNPMSDSGVSISSVKMLELEERIQAKCDGKWVTLKKRLAGGCSSASVRLLDLFA